MLRELLRPDRPVNYSAGLNREVPVSGWDDEDDGNSRCDDMNSEKGDGI